MDRYDTPAMAGIWGERARNGIERGLWIEVMKAQAQVGLPIPQEAIADYERSAELLAAWPDGASDLDELAEIAKIEQQTRHDLYARMTFFNRMAGHEYTHWGLTSADIVELAQQIQIGNSVRVLCEHADQVLVRLGGLTELYADAPMVARTHGQPAQVTTIGKRFADWAAALASGILAGEDAMEAYHPRGIKGAVGTMADMQALAQRHLPERVESVVAKEIEELVCDSASQPALPSVGQCYPRGLDLPMVATALQVVAACETIAVNVRLWSLLGHAREHQTEGQVGSSAMPHKVNPRYSERVCGLAAVTRGYATMLQSTSGGMWFEGDVSTSSVRRVALPGLFHAADAVVANTAYVLDRLELDEQTIHGDVDENLVKLSSGRLLEALMAAGSTRSQAHDTLRRMMKDGAGFLVTSDDPAHPLHAARIAGLLDAQLLARPAAGIARRVAESLSQGRTALDPAWPGDLV